MVFQLTTSLLETGVNQHNLYISSTVIAPIKSDQSFLIIKQQLFSNHQ